MLTLSSFSFDMFFMEPLVPLASSLNTRRVCESLNTKLSQRAFTLSRGTSSQSRSGRKRNGKSLSTNTVAPTKDVYKRQVVGVLDVNQLVGDDVVDELGGRLDDSPVETEGSVCVTRTPALLGLADEDGLRSHSCLLYTSRCV